VKGISGAHVCSGNTTVLLLKQRRLCRRRLDEGDVPREVGFDNHCSRQKGLKAGDEGFGKCVSWQQVSIDVVGARCEVELVDETSARGPDSARGQLPMEQSVRR
jgi:hypothetical protein